MKQPTVFLTMNTTPTPSFFAFDERGEVIETTTTAEGKPEWADGGICDVRGSGSAAGFRNLRDALNHAENVARHSGYRIERIPA